MKQFEVNKSFLENLHGLSCIENYFLYFLSINNYPYKYLYYNSAISFDNIAFAFISDDVHYANFNQTPRLHKVALQNKLIKIWNYKGDDYNEYILTKDYVCIRVTPEFIKDKYNIELWRDDHYILLRYLDNENYTYLNDNPRDQGVISRVELNKAYGGQMIGFEILHEIEDDLKSMFFHKFFLSISKDEKIINLTYDNIIKARDTLGVLRVLRKRIYDYCSLYINIDFMSEYLRELDKQYTTLEYMRVRKKVDHEKVNDILKFLQERDKSVIELIKNRMGAII